jgi:hypothetical protein
LFHYSSYGILFCGSLSRLMDVVVVGVLRLGCLMFLPCCVVSNGIVGVDCRILLWGSVDGVA